MEENVNLEVLVTTMHQHDTKKYDEMNLQTNAVIANQADANGYGEEVKNGHTVKIMTTDTKGSSRNRNIALSLSTGDFIMFTDDDVIFKDGYGQLILQEFQEHPEAEAIRFDMQITAISESKKVEHSKVPMRFRRATRRELARYGVCGLVIRKDVLKKHCLHFNELFGPGTDNYCGEDTIFLQNMINKKIKLYLSPVTIATIDKSGSSWFEGYNQQYFYVTGKVFAAVYPHLARVLAIRSSYKFSKRQGNMTFFDILKCYLAGIRDYLHE